MRINSKTIRSELCVIQKKEKMKKIHKDFLLSSRKIHKIGL